jgi:hypothetical protein
MATPVESANLILRLYELRREPIMRDARNFFLSFDPRSVEDYMAGMMGPNSAHIRMVVSYWEMAASFVTSGAIDPKMFEDSAGEHILVFGKIETFLPKMREMMGNPTMFSNLEQVCTSAPGGLEKVRATTERIRGMMAQRGATAAS